MTGLLALLLEFHREKLTMMLQHQAGARFIGQYDVNNTYQYIINRDEVQLSWLQKAIEELGGAPSQAGGSDRTVSASRWMRRSADSRSEPDSRLSKTWITFGLFPPLPGRVAKSARREALAARARAALRSWLPDAEADGVAPVAVVAR